MPSIRFIGYSPTFVAHCCVYNDDKGKLPIDPAILLDPLLDGERAHRSQFGSWRYFLLCRLLPVVRARLFVCFVSSRLTCGRYMQSIPCSIQRFSKSECVVSHHCPPDLFLYEAVHDGNYIPAISSKNLDRVESVVSRCGMAQEIVARGRLAAGRSAAEARADAMLTSAKRWDLGSFMSVPVPPPPKAPLQQECYGCRKTNEELGISDMKRCARCMIARYCSAACQKSHWPMHKVMCKKC